MTKACYFAAFGPLKTTLSYLLLIAGLASASWAASPDGAQDSDALLKPLSLDLEAFSYSVSHDLRAPLRHIGAFSKILTEEYGSKMGPDAGQHLNRIQNGVTNMGRLIDDFLKLAQIGRKELVCDATDLDSMLRNVVADLQPECEDRQIDWHIGNLPSVECDAGLMKQVFANLISNAVKYTRRRDIAVIEIGQVEEEDGPVIFVRDNGAGFDQRYADKLFGVFQGLHRAEDFEGTGVGLSTVQRIIKKHGGEIWAKGEVDKGATFFFSHGQRTRSYRHDKSCRQRAVSQHPRWKDPPGAHNVEKRSPSAREPIEFHAAQQVLLTGAVLPVKVEVASFGQAAPAHWPSAALKARTKTCRVFHSGFRSEFQPMSAMVSAQRERGGRVRSPFRALVPAEIPGPNC
jgi:hypothetical protein